MTVRTSARPAVWICCFACYDNGMLNGEWFPAEDAAEATPDDLHGAPTTRDELWLFDLEGFPADVGETSPSAVAWGELCNELGEAPWSAVIAWADFGSCAAEGVGDLPSLGDLEDLYQVEWDSSADYAVQLAEDTGLTDGWPAAAQRYGDYDAWSRGLAFDYTVPDVTESGVFIFRCC